MTSTLVSTMPLKRLKWTSTGLTVPVRLQTLVKTAQFLLTVRPYSIFPAAMPYRMWSNFQYREGSTVCTGLRRGHLYQRLMSRRKQNSLFSANPSGLPGRNSKELHKASRASGNEVRLIVVEGWLAGSPALQSASTYTTMAHCVPPVCCRGPHLRRIAFEINNGMP